MNKFYQKCPINHQFSYFIWQFFMFYKTAELVISFQHTKIKNSTIRNIYEYCFDEFQTACAVSFITADYDRRSLSSFQFISVL